MSVFEIGIKNNNNYANKQIIFAVEIVAAHVHVWTEIINHTIYIIHIGQRTA